MIPRFSTATLDGDRAALRAACRDVGAFTLRLDDAAGARLGATMAHARAFFALPAADKRALDIARSPHHRGYSELHNARDWREQLHVGSERPARACDGAPEWARLAGPNQWPPALGADFAATLLAHQDEMAALGRRLLALLALPMPTGDAYLVTKLIHYHPQPRAHELRSGVAAHVDYSLVTLLAQDDVGGLELQTRDGVWRAVDPSPATLVVNVGELAEAQSGGALRATPHRVTNVARDRSRLSIPVFVNPPLDAVVAVPASHALPRASNADDVAHVHRVLPAVARASFHYGAAEWQRKGRNIWCHDCCKPA
jgi:isopenicillin N synthase-like dioxygenase